MLGGLTGFIHLLPLSVYVSALLDEGHRSKSRDTLETSSHSGNTLISFSSPPPDAYVYVPRGPHAPFPVPIRSCSCPQLTASLVFVGFHQVGSLAHQKPNAASKEQWFHVGLCERGAHCCWAGVMEGLCWRGVTASHRDPDGII